MRELDKKTIDAIFEHARKIENGEFRERKGIIATAFFEPSTRTKLSFQSAAERLGMKVVDFIPEVSSLVKGESFSDTIRMLDNYADVIVIRHQNEGSSKLAAKLAKKPVINGGDGANEHPTQALIDLYTILKEKKKIAGLKIVLFGDLKHARSMHSLLYGLGMYNTEIVLIAPKGLEPSTGIIEEIKKKFNVKITQKSEPDFSGADVIYAVRVQEERFADKYEAKKIKEQFRLEFSHLKNAKEDVIVLHPLPKIDEISAEVDKSAYAKYFEQAANAVPVRMATIEYCLKGAS